MTAKHWKVLGELIEDLFSRILDFLLVTQDHRSLSHLAILILQIIISFVYVLFVVMSFRFSNFRSPIMRRLANCTRKAINTGIVTLTCFSAG